jgi:Protein of unknown function (DUF2442)
MPRDIVSVQVIPPHQIHLQFEDGVTGTVDLSRVIEFSGIFAPLQDSKYFATVQVNPEIGTIAWSNGADLDPDVLYAIVTQQTLPSYQDDGQPMVVV